MKQYVNLKQRSGNFSAVFQIFICLLIAATASCAREPAYVDRVLDVRGGKTVVPTWQTSTKVSIANKENFYRAVKNFSNDTGFLFEIRELLLTHEFTEMILSKGDESIVVDNYKAPDQYVAVFFLGNDSALNSALVDKYSRCCLEGFE